MNRRAILLVVLTFFGLSAASADVTLPELFKQAKAKFAASDFKGSLADFDLLDTMSAKPGLESDRAKLIPVITFYRGANLAALGRKSEAKEAFISYLGYTPNASIASPPFPKATVAIFEEARDEAGTVSKTIAAGYATFATPSGWTLAADEQWIDSPVRHLLTPAQKKEYATFTTAAERATFVEAFWRQLDPTPNTDPNELRTEFERRVAFADVNFSTEKLAGRFTDQAAIFAYLGAPTYASVSQMSDDAIGRLRASGDHEEGDFTTNKGFTNGRGLKNRINTNFWANERKKEDNLETDSRRAKREAWYYRSDRLPPNLPYKEVRFDFITKEGYGTGVLQKETEPMQTLGVAEANARKEKKLYNQ
jgi:GWxTD domain-containing protein